MNQTSCQLWECLSPKDLVALVNYQWTEYGLKAEILSDKPDVTYHTEVEDTAEIDYLMRERRPTPKGKG